MTFGDSRNQAGEHSLAGDLLCLLSALFYSAYTVAIRKMLPSDDHADVSVFFGFIGVINLVGMAPVLLILWLLSAVHLQGITAWIIFLAVCKGEQCMCISWQGTDVYIFQPALPVMTAQPQSYLNFGWTMIDSASSVIICPAHV